jgi:hypothetical protein
MVASIRGMLVNIRLIVLPCGFVRISRVLRRVRLFSNA